jgi:hypothetical protein
VNIQLTNEVGKKAKKGVSGAPLVPGGLPFNDQVAVGIDVAVLLCSPLY